jgi:hypothetical protein
MTKLSITATLNNLGEISVANSTGLTPAAVDGFLPSATVINWDNTTQSNSFKLSEVYFFNVLIYNPYNADPVVKNIVGNELEAPIQITADADFPVLLNKKYTITTDGYYTVSQIIALQKSYYETNKLRNRFVDKNYIVYDEILKKLYHAKNGVYTELTIIEVLDEDLVSVDYMKSVVKKFSYINLQSCYIKKTDDYIKSTLATCSTPIWYNEYFILYSAIEVIKYQIELCNYTASQKYVEWMNNCVGICTTTTTTDSAICNCG